MNAFELFSTESFSENEKQRTISDYRRLSPSIFLFEFLYFLIHWNFGHWKVISPQAQLKVFSGYLKVKIQWSFRTRLNSIESLSNDVGINRTFVMKKFLEIFRLWKISADSQIESNKWILKISFTSLVRQSLSQIRNWEIKNPESKS